MKRAFQTIISGLIILLFMLYGYIKSEVVYQIPFKDTAPCMSSNGSKIIGSGPDFMKIKWENGSTKTIYLNSPPPFKKNDIVAFKLIKNGDKYDLQEYHIWESKSKWFGKAFFSFIPLLFILIYFNRHFRFGFSQLTFFQRKGGNA